MAYILTAGAVDPTTQASLAGAYFRILQLIYDPINLRINMLCGIWASNAAFTANDPALFLPTYTFADGAAGANPYGSLASNLASQAAQPDPIISAAYVSLQSHTIAGPLLAGATATT